MRGPKPTPTALKILRGNPGHRAINQSEPVPPTDIDLTAPEMLSPDAKIEWDDKAPLLHGMGLLSSADLDALTIYCQTFARWKAAERELLKYGLLIKSSSNNGFPMVSPYLAISNAAQKQCVRMLSEFGLTPSSRSRVSTTPGRKPHGNAQRRRFFGAAPNPRQSE